MYRVITKIETPPTNYDEWIQCFNQLNNALLDKSSAIILSRGSCVAYNQVKPYLHREMQKAVNIIIKEYVNELNREIKKYSEFNEINNLHIPFVRFATKIENSLFFINLDFMDSSFKKELCESVISEINRFWSNVILSFKRQALETGNSLIEEEYYRISRIKLFKNLLKQ